MSVPLPKVPSDRLTQWGWTELEQSEETLFDAHIVTVEAHTVVYADSQLRERIRDAIDIDAVWRFFLAAKLELGPTVPHSRALTDLVANRSHSGFADTLAERGFSEVVRAEHRRIENGEDCDERARVAGYDAVCVIENVSLRTRGWAAVWPADDGYVLAGGGYPTAVRESSDGDTAETLQEYLEPERFEIELFTLIRETR